MQLLFAYVGVVYAAVDCVPCHVTQFRPMAFTYLVYEFYGMTNKRLYKTTDRQNYYQ